MQVILNLETIVNVSDVEDAASVHASFWEHPHNSWLTDDDGRYDTIVVQEGTPIGYVSGNGRLWAWDDWNDVRECETFSNPFTNGSITCDKWNAVKNTFIPDPDR